jgi:hypothetical protein
MWNDGLSSFDGPRRTVAARRAKAPNAANLSDQMARAGWWFRVPLLRRTGLNCRDGLTAHSRAPPKRAAFFSSAQAPHFCDAKADGGSDDHR